MIHVCDSGAYLTGEAQLINYLKATAIEVGLLVNFGQSVEIKRKVYTIPKDGVPL